MTWQEIELKHKNDWREYDHFCHMAHQKMQENHLQVKQLYEAKGQDIPPNIKRSMRAEFDEWNAMWGKDGIRINQIIQNHLWQREHFLNLNANQPVVYHEMKKQLDEISFHYNKRDYMAYQPEPIKTNGMLLVIRTWFYNIFKIHV